jgi:hypothetical protein
MGKAGTVLVVVIGVVLFFTTFSNAFKNSSSSYRAVPTRAPALRSVEYRVTAGANASLTYTNANGSTEQKDVYANPWTYKFSARSGSHAYVSAQHSKNGAISCKILVDGVEYKSANSSGQYVIATCSGAVP